eukprot:97056_1
MAWQSLKTFPTKYVASIPSHHQKNKIIYSTSYNSYDADNRGIFEYNAQTDQHKIIKLWKHINYFPVNHSSIYNPSKQEIICVGGGGDEYRNIMMIYNIKQNTIKKIKCLKSIGQCPGLVVTKNNMLHIVGGDENDGHHIIYNLVTNKSFIVHTFNNKSFCKLW